MPDRLYDRNFALAVISQTCFVIANTLMAHYARWIEFLRGDVAQIGWIMGVGATMGLVLRPWMAQWINRLGARSMWAIGYGVFSAGTIANLWVDDLGLTIYIIRSLVVLGAAIVFASSMTYVSQAYPESRRTEAIGILGVGGFLGMLVGPYLGDLFLGAESARIRGGFITLFIVAASANVLPALLLLLMRSSHHQVEKAPVRLMDFVGTCRLHWPGMILLIDLAFGVCMTAPFVFLASYIDRVPVAIPHFSAIGLFFWCYAGLAILVRIGLRDLPARIGARRVLLAGGCLMSAGMFSYSLVDAQHPWLIIVPAFLCGAGHGLMFHTMTALTLKSFPLHVHGTGSALALMMLDLGMIAGAPVLGVVGDRFGYPAMFATSGALCLAATVAYGFRRTTNSPKSQLP